jgi:hypothetical protein
MEVIMLKNLLGGAAFVAILAASPAFAGGLSQTLPQIGGPSFCASTVTGTGGLSSNTGQGQGTTGAICAQTVPAGPPTFTGSESTAVDLFSPGSSNGSPVQSANVNIQQLDQGALLDNTTVATATIPAGVVFYSLDGAQAGAFTITMPAVAVDGQFQEVMCTAATVGVLTVAPNTTVVTQLLKNNPAAACVAGTVFKWRFNAANLTWFRV